MNASKILHYIALILGFQASAFFMFFLISDGVADLFSGKFSVIPILIMMIFTVIGYIWAISKPKLGSLIMISGGVVMALYLIILGGTVGIKMALVYGLPFIVPGLIFYFVGDRGDTKYHQDIDL
jgi:uncharacterized membrane protein (UPF0136 family)